MDDRQDILGQVSNFQASQPEEAAHGEEEQAAHQRRPTVHSSQPNVFSQRGTSNKLTPGRQLHRSASSGTSQKRKSQSEEYTMSEKTLAGRKALVTGGARGIGAAIAEALTNAGAAVMIGDILSDLGKETASRLAKTGAKTGFVELNVTDDAQWERAVATTIATLSGYDILINNAGIEVTSLVVDLKAEDLRRMCDVNIVGTGLGMKHAFRAMRPGGGAGAGGAIVNVASVAATIAFPAIAGYSGTKSAVDRMTRVAAMEAGKLGYGVRVNCLYPGLSPPTWACNWPTT
ncbi:SDR family NAD(P)-dependent oxidoreductase [Bradyrhizobium erythrophlei]|uniref:SDR family NAD(P)-dependent oxidoreductase n=1 Tax=Bradyrhizobium erythrophlei TaxID=1437360 RepID=UPI0023EA77F9|nr:SDR family NAD(P)-dependent oxidoreductase [Bradyrhizobium erythrophlei]